MTSLLIYDASSGQAGDVTGFLAADNRQVARVESSREAQSALRRNRPNLLVFVERHEELAGEDAESALVRETARKLGIPVLFVVDDAMETEHIDDADDWVTRGCLARELSPRVARLLRKRSGSNAGDSPERFTFSPDALSLIVHDLRTPLNVIGLSFRMISHSIPRGDLELDQDVTFLEESYQLLVRMLQQISDYQRLHEQSAWVHAVDFDPKRLVSELVEGWQTRPGGKPPKFIVEIDGTCPHEVALEPLRARLALQYVLNNAVASAEGQPIRVALRGGEDRWITDVVIDQGPPETVTSVPLHSMAFERVCGFPAERRGMDLAIAAKVSELFGGSAELIAEPKRTVVSLDWPTRLLEA